MFSIILSFIFFFNTTLSNGFSGSFRPELMAASESAADSNGQFSPGEELEFKVTFGFFSVGKANMKMYDKLYKVNGRECYKVDIFGKTTGAVDWVAKVDDNWGAFIDADALLPHISYRNIKEGNYRKKEISRFDHKSNMVEVKVLNNKTGQYKEPLYIQVPTDVKDMIGGYLFLRTLDFKQLTAGDIIELSALFEDTLYDFRVLFEGREVVKTKAGTFNTVKLKPLMPDNKIFAGENSISVWFSDDDNKIPIKIEADMFVGKAGCELTDYKGLKHSPQALVAKN